jgi:hypothetical protein
MSKKAAAIKNTPQPAIGAPASGTASQPPEQVISDAQRVSDRKLKNAAVPITPENPLPYSQ